jgi:hypothetical protein
MPPPLDINTIRAVLDNLGSWFLVCNLILNQLDENERRPKFFENGGQPQFFENRRLPQKNYEKNNATWNIKD